MKPEEIKRMKSAVHAFFERGRTSDVDMTMAAVSDDPHYEFVSAGWKMDGRDAVREALRRIYACGNNEVLSAEERVLAIAPGTVCHESFTVRRIKGEPVTCRSVAIITFDGDLVSGERLYSDPIVAEVMNDAFGADFEDFPGVSRIP